MQMQVKMRAWDGQARALQEGESFLVFRYGVSLQGQGLELKAWGSESVVCINRSNRNFMLSVSELLDPKP